MKIKIDRLDKLFSEFIRKRAVKLVSGCERCRTPYNWKQLQCSHFYSRSMKSVRYDIDNGCGVCFGCHQYLGSHPLEHVRFFEDRLDGRFDLLEARARITQKPDRESIQLFLEEKLNKLDA